MVTPIGTVENPSIASPAVRGEDRGASQSGARKGEVGVATAVDETVIHVLWINAGLSCDGDSVALTAATQPSIEEIALGALPGLPKIAVHWPLIDFECGPVGGADDFIEWFFKADRGELEPFVLVVEGRSPTRRSNARATGAGSATTPTPASP